MKKFAFIAGIALAAPAFAQSTATPAAAPMAAPTTATPAPAAATPAPAPAAAPSDPASILKTEFPNYDKDASGALDKSEMGAWLTALRNAQPASAKTTLTPAQQAEWLGKSFTDADSDKSGTVNLAELTKHLIPAA